MTTKRRPSRPRPYSPAREVAELQIWRRMVTCPACGGDPYHFRRPELGSALNWYPKTETPFCSVCGDLGLVDPLAKIAFNHFRPPPPKDFA